MASNIVVLHSVPVDTVENGQTRLPSIRLRSSPTGEGPWVLSPPDGFLFPVKPGEGAAVPGHLTTGPEVFCPLSSNQLQEVLRLLLGVETDQLHALALTVSLATVPIKVVPASSPGEEEPLPIPPIVTLGGRIGGDGLGGSGGSGCSGCSRGFGGWGCWAGPG